MIKKYTVFFLTFLTMIAWAGLQPATPAPAGVGLAWDASPDPAVVSYNVYWGVSSGNYTNVISVTTTTTFIAPLVRGTTYYFAATCVAAGGLESVFSAELSYTAPNRPAPPVLRLARLSDGQIQLTISAQPYETCLIQVSQDLKSWIVLGQVTPDSTGRSVFTDITAPFYSLRFYRTVC